MPATPPSTKVLPVTLPSSGSSTIPAIAPICSAALSIMTMARQFSMVAPLPTMPPTCFAPDRRPLAQLPRIVDLLIPATPPTPVASSASRVPKPLQSMTEPISASPTMPPAFCFLALIVP